MLMNWIVPLLVVMTAAIFATAWKGYGGPESMRHWLLLICAGGVLASIPIHFGLARRARHRRTRTPFVTAGIAAVGITMLVIGGLDSLFDRIFHPPNGESVGGLVHLKQWKAGILVAVPALVPAVLRFMPIVRSPKARKILNVVCLWLAGLLVPLLGITAFFLLRVVGEMGMDGNKGFWLGLGILLGCFVGLALLAWLVLDVNLTAPFRLYRDGIRGTFVNNEDAEESEADLSALNPAGKGPCHLINCTVNLPSSTAIELRERKSDFFLFSKHWTGSPVVGYNQTNRWRMNGENPDLASAVAISGAAFSSHMGLGSIPPLRALLTFLNVRLGYWIHQPGENKDLPTDSLRHPGFSCLVREMTGLRMSEKQQWLNLSDGGHIENLATYELLRRRCKFIICVDGEADPDLTFHGFMTLVRHARIDLGVRIDADLDDIRPDPATGLSRSHYQLCRVHYPDGTSGLLLYLKLSVTGNESELIKRYRGTCPEFPHQTTLDQFFDEEQFEAYRQLGVHVAEGLFAPCLMGGEGHPWKVGQWFKKLANSLLEPSANRDLQPVDES